MSRMRNCLRGRFILAAAAAISIPASAQVKPALVRDVDRASAQPVRGNCQAFAQPGGSDAKCVLYAVPAGKRLFVESVSYKVFTGGTINDLVFGEDSPMFSNIIFGPAVYEITLPAAVNYSSVKMVAGSQNISFYIEEGQSLAANFSYSGGPSYQQIFGFSGHLVDK